jgi:hypothetical protein
MQTDPDVRFAKVRALRAMIQLQPFWRPGEVNTTTLVGHSSVKKILSTICESASAAN